MYLCTYIQALGYSYELLTEVNSNYCDIISAWTFEQRRDVTFVDVKWEVMVEICLHVTVSYLIHKILEGNT